MARSPGQPTVVARGVATVVPTVLYRQAWLTNFRLEEATWPGERLWIRHKRSWLIKRYMQLLKFKGDPVGPPPCPHKVRPCNIIIELLCTRAFYCRACARACPQPRRLSVAQKRRGRRQPAAGAAKKNPFVVFLSFARLGTYVSSFQQHGWEASVDCVFNCNMPPPDERRPAAGAAPKYFCSFARVAASQPTSFFVYWAVCTSLAVRKITNPPACGFRRTSV